jgi:hypothetical protein
LIYWIRQKHNKIKQKGGQAARLVFARERRKTDRLALISTDFDLSNEDIVRVYGKRWDIVELLSN